MIFHNIDLNFSNERQKILVIGHRGAAGHVPENTLKSFEKAIEIGVDMIEFDVISCKTGQLVIIHDETVDRTTDGTGFVKDMSLDELKILDVGQGQKISTLEEALDFIDRRVRVNIELKSKGAEKSVAMIIEDYVKNKNWQYSDFLVSSFDHDQILVLNKLYPKIQFATLWDSVPKIDEILGNVFVIDYELVTKDFIKKSHEAGKKVYAYTINDTKDVKLLLGYGIDGIISDYPDKVISCLE